MKIRVGFSRTNSWISKGIRWFLGTNISHTYIRYHDEFMEIDTIAHADWPGVLTISADKFDRDNVAVEEYEFDIPKPALKYNLHKFLGNRYDYLAIFGWAWTITVRRWLKQKIKNPKDDPKKLICVDWCLRVLNSAKLTNINPASMNPKHLLQFLRDNYEALGGKRFIFESTSNAISNALSSLKDGENS